MLRSIYFSSKIILYFKKLVIIKKHFNELYSYGSLVLIFDRILYGIFDKHASWFCRAQPLYAFSNIALYWILYCIPGKDASWFSDAHSLCAVSNNNWYWIFYCIFGKHGASNSCALNLCAFLNRLFEKNN